MSTITTDLRIEGMSCRHCVDAVEGGLKALPGVEIEEIAIGRVRLSFDQNEVSPDDLREAVEDAGYTLASSDQVA